MRPKLDLLAYELAREEVIVLLTAIRTMSSLHLSLTAPVVFEYLTRYCLSQGFRYVVTHRCRMQPGQNKC